MTDTNQNTTIEKGSSKLSSTQWAPQVLNFGLRVSAPSPPTAKIDNGNSKYDRAPGAPQGITLNPGASVNLPHLLPQQLQFLLRVTPPALDSQREYEVPACVTIAQAILESATPKLGWGSSVLFRLANNPFGIKYCHWRAGDGKSGRSGDRGIGRASDAETGKSGEQGKEDSGFRIPNSAVPMTNSGSRIPDSESRLPNTESPAYSAQTPALIPDPYGAFDARTWEIENGEKKAIISLFQRFPNLTEAFRAHALLLRGPRYRPAFAVRDDWKKFAERLGPKTSQLDSEHCGYSTNPSYSAQLQTLVNLYRLNDPRALQWFATGKDPGSTATLGCEPQAGVPVPQGML